MFKFTEYYDVIQDAYGNDLYQYNLIDSDFTVAFYVKKQNRPHIVTQILKIYENKGLNCQNAIARYYLWGQFKSRIRQVIEQDAKMIEEHFVRGYGTKYMPCILNKCKTIAWSTRTNV